MYVNGKNVGSATRSAAIGSGSNNTFNIGSGLNSSSTNVDFFDGKISNFRVVKGTAVYTSSFKVPTEPLKNITNTVLLCCNDSSATGSTVTPGTITNNGDPTASTDSPFDDPAGFKFGEVGDQNIIKCGSYTTGFRCGCRITYIVGWEPSWVMVKSN